MTLNQLRYIVKIAEVGNISEAAQKLFISQPSLTNAVHSLEDQMHVTIFNRTNKGVTLTNEGKEFLSYARQVFALRIPNPNRTLVFLVNTIPLRSMPWSMSFKPLMQTSMTLPYGKPRLLKSSMMSIKELVKLVFFIYQKTMKMSSQR